MTATLVQGFRRYEFTCKVSDFLLRLATELNTYPYVDPNWKVIHYPSDPYSQPKAYNNNALYGSPLGSATLENLNDPSLFFSLCLNMPVQYAWTTMQYQLRLGMKRPSSGVLPYPDVSLEMGEFANIPFQTGTSNWTYDSNYKWTVFPMKESMFIFGEALDNLASAYPFRLYLGKLKSYEEEDPAVKNGFVGVFSHAPVHHDNAWANNTKYNVGRGIVRTSRNNTKNEYYNFCTSSQATSPGAGNRYFMSPWYVYNPKEGVRGEFKQMRSVVFKDANQHPDGSMIDLEGKRYHVFHVNDQEQPSNYHYWYDLTWSNRAIQPYFFDSHTLLGVGQRAVLFELENTEVSN